MFITSAGPEDVLRWFKNADHGQEVLCLLLTKEASLADVYSQEEKQSRGGLLSLIRNYSRTNVALGSRIAFLVFHAQTSKMLELPGARNTRKVFFADDLMRPEGDVTVPLSEVPVFKDVSADSFARRMVLAQETTESTLQLDASFVELLGLEARCLPAICTFVQGIEDVAIKSLPTQWTEKDVEDYFHELQAFLQALDAAPPPPPMGGIEQAYGHLKDLITSIDASKNKLDTVLQALAKKAGLTGPEQRLVERFINQENGTSEALQDLFVRLPSIDFSLATLESRRVKCLRLAGRIDDALGLLRGYHLERFNETEDMQQERIEKRRAELLTFIKKLSGEHAQTSLGAPRALPAGFWTVLDRVNKLSDLTKHLSDLLKPLIS
ncbi:hypothetical protein [Pseudomonas koreensis]|uniref:hypothetical protein n=1 Tax=Pseudomonas koreensis TaxID=198620 RepID=UPI00320ADA92